MTELNTSACWVNYIIEIILMIKMNSIKIACPYLLQQYWKLVINKKYRKYKKNGYYVTFDTL